MTQRRPNLNAPCVVRHLLHGFSAHALVLIQMSQDVLEHLSGVLHMMSVLLNMLTCSPASLILDLPSLSATGSTPPAGQDQSYKGYQRLIITTGRAAVPSSRRLASCKQHRHVELQAWNSTGSPRSELPVNTSCFEMQWNKRLLQRGVWNSAWQRAGHSSPRVFSSIFWTWPMILVQLLGIIVSYYSIIL